MKVPQAARAPLWNTINGSTTHKQGHPVTDLIWSFAPWLAFVLALRATSLYGAIAAALVVAVLVLARAVTRQRVHVLDGAALTLIVFGSILVGHPFTQAYDRDTTPRELWDTPQYHAVNQRISAVLGLAFLVGPLALIIAGSADDRQVLLRLVVPFGALAFAYG